MGIFSRIKEKLFGSAENQGNTPVTSGASSTVTADTTAPAATYKGDKSEKMADPATPDEVTATLTGAHSAPVMATSAGQVDVAAVMDAAVRSNGQKLDWRRSIVDMMKELDLDSSLSARKELADELGFTGDKNDSAGMNIWLHKALMKALADNGGKVPDELLD
jgi:hypothetical protein